MAKLTSKSGLMSNHLFRGETTKLLSLSVAQIHHSLTEGDNSVNALTSTFKNLADICFHVKSHISDPENLDLEKLDSLTDNLTEQINSAIVAFQFYDRLSQRLDHVALNLESLSDILASDEAIKDKDQWQKLRLQIKQRYTIEAEHVMFNAIMGGATVQEAIELYNKFHERTGEFKDIEFF
ncbi:hypothetical protein [Flocculibacter collagenilyticus]|uniref:hypothetical protein n=1 Tax=Flocculibacter collagenilyticus TaxID=2744479 RepID=UPI0018F4D492|nr:hypothetical protein [Flocculibacter collagenilyticus]